MSRAATSDATSEASRMKVGVRVKVGHNELELHGGDSGVDI